VLVEQHVAYAAGGGETGVVDVVDVAAGHGLAAGVGAAAGTAHFVVAAIGQQFLPDVSVRGHPHADHIHIRRPAAGALGAVSGSALSTYHGSVRS
jgi:hypothetical protein